ncbi:hypothetical protein GCM10010448_57140 [Streptomyces glomeratus]|uniref:Uncharacterized protein n=1 Tax=Streptomyces glomeratus TaxID=284452 RepID=A0ABP6M0Y5_9ACTN
MGIADLTGGCDAGFGAPRKAFAATGCGARFVAWDELVVVQTPACA